MSKSAVQFNSYLELDIETDPISITHYVYVGNEDDPSIKHIVPLKVIIDEVVESYLTPTDDGEWILDVDMETFRHIVARLHEIADYLDTEVVKYSKPS